MAFQFIASSPPRSWAVSVVPTPVISNQRREVAVSSSNQVLRTLSVAGSSPGGVPAQRCQRRSTPPASVARTGLPSSHQSGVAGREIS